MRFNDNRPIFEQIAELIEDRIASGDLVEGERIPSARDVAASLEVNPNTAARALQALADNGAARVERGAGYFVAEGAAAAIQNRRRAAFFRDELPRLFKRMRTLDINMSEISRIWNEGEQA